MTLQQHFGILSISLSRLPPRPSFISLCSPRLPLLPQRFHIFPLSGSSTTWFSIFLSTWLWLPKSWLLSPCLCNSCSSKDSFLFPSCLLHSFQRFIFGKMLSFFQCVTLFPENKDPTSPNHSPLSHPLVNPLSVLSMFLTLLVLLPTLLLLC